MQVPKFGWMPSGADSGTSGILSFDKKLKDMVISVQLAVLLPVSSGAVSSGLGLLLRAAHGGRGLRAACRAARFVAACAALFAASAAPVCAFAAFAVGAAPSLASGVIVSSDEFKGYVVCVFVQVRVTDATVKCHQIYIFVFVRVVMNSGFEEALMGIGCAAMMPVPPVVSSFPGFGAALSGPCPSGLVFAQSPDMRLCLCFQSFRIT